MKRILFLALILLTTLIGCEKKKETPSVTKKAQPATAVELKVPKPKLLFEEPSTAHKFELPSEALQVWRHTKSVKPALVLFSIHPFLEPLIEEQKEDVSQLIESGAAPNRAGSRTADFS